MDGRNSIFSFTIYWQFLRSLKTSIHKVVFKQSLSFTIKQARTYYKSFQIWFRCSCSKAQSFNGLYLFILKRRLSQREILIIKPRINFLLLSLSRLGCSLFLRVSFFRRIVVTFLLISFFFFFRRSICPSHNIRNAYEYFLLSIGMYFQGGDNKFRLFQITFIQVIDNNI